MNVIIIDSCNGGVVETGICRFKIIIVGFDLFSRQDCMMIFGFLLLTCWDSS